MKTKLILLSLFCLFCFAMTAQSKTIQLVSGRVLEGKILEKTDEYVKLRNLKGDVLKIPLKQIEDPQETFSEQTQKREIVTSKTIWDFQKWMESNKENFTTIGRLNSECCTILRHSGQQIQEAFRNGKIAEGRKISLQTEQQIISLKKQLEGLSLGDELKGYQQKMIESFDHFIKSLRIWQLCDQQGYYRYYRYGVKSYADAIQELRYAYGLMGAPPGLLDVMDLEVNDLKQRSNNMYQKSEKYYRPSQK